MRLTRAHLLLAFLIVVIFVVPHCDQTPPLAAELRIEDPATGAFLRCPEIVGEIQYRYRAGSDDAIALEVPVRCAALPAGSRLLSDSFEG